MTTTEYHLQKLPQELIEYILSFVVYFDEGNTTKPVEHWLHMQSDKLSICFVDVPQYPDILTGLSPETTSDYSIMDEIKKANMIYLVYDITNRKSFEDIEVSANQLLKEGLQIHSNTMRRYYV